MVHHVFLTGAKHAGKSTLLQSVWQQFPGTSGGFCTVKTDTVPANRTSVHMLPADGSALPDEGNLLFICNGEDEHIGQRFDRLGCELLAQCRGKDLIVMDELGPHEAQAERFRAAVIELLDGDTPILGVLQAPADVYWPEIVKHPGVEIIDVRQSDRENEVRIRQILSVIGNDSADN